MCISWQRCQIQMFCVILNWARCREKETTGFWRFLWRRIIWLWILTREDPWSRSSVFVHKTTSSTINQFWRLVWQIKLLLHCTWNQIHTAKQPIDCISIKIGAGPNSNSNSDDAWQEKEFNFKQFKIKALLYCNCNLVI